MPVLKITGLVFLSLLLLVALFCLLNVSLILRTADNRELQVFMRIFGINFKVKTKTAKNKSAQTEKKPGFFSRFFRHLGLPDKKHLQKTQKSVKIKGAAATVQKIAELLTPLLAAGKTVLHAARVKKLSVSYISGGDAADAAMGYGLACSVLYPLGELVSQSNLSGKNAVNIAVSCDYNRPAAFFALDFKMSVRIGFLLLAALRFLKVYLKQS